MPNTVIFYNNPINYKVFVCLLVLFLIQRGDHVLTASGFDLFFILRFTISYKIQPSKRILNAINLARMEIINYIRICILEHTNFVVKFLFIRKIKLSSKTKEGKNHFVYFGSDLSNF